MSYGSKKTIASMAAGILLFIGYTLYALRKQAQGMGGIAAWATTILAFIGISIAAVIVIQILFHILLAAGTAAKQPGSSDKEIGKALEITMAEDEMDRLISLKSERIGYICAGLGFIGVLLSLSLGASPVFALHLLLGAFGAGSLLEGGVSVYLYERGVRNG